MIKEDYTNILYYKNIEILTWQAQAGREEKVEKNEYADLISLFMVMGWHGKNYVKTYCLNMTTQQVYLSV